MMRRLIPTLPIVLFLSACGIANDPRWDGPPSMLPTGLSLIEQDQ